MKVTTVTATIRYSAETQGAWKSVEVGAEATLTNSDETWEQAQAELYHSLGQQLKALWSGKTNPPEAKEQPGTRPVSPATARQHFCKEHGVEFKARNGQYGEFWRSHQVKGTRQWCNESKR
jgi:hypothetical protein